MGETNSTADGVGARMAQVVALPARTAGSGMRAVMDWSDSEVDDWGRESPAVARAWTLSHLRWNVTLGGAEHLDRRRGGLIVVNARRFALSPVIAALALGDATQRPVRFLGRPDTAPIGPLMQRLGGLLPHVSELTNVLRAGDLVVTGTSPTLGIRQVGLVDHRIVGAAVAAGVPTYPAAMISSPMRRGARLEIGTNMRPKRQRRGPLAELELADDLAATIGYLLQELGDAGGVLR
jgi:hypothetical protein